MNINMLMQQAKKMQNDMEKAKEAYAKIVCAYEVQQEEPNPVPMIKGILK